MVDRPTEPGLYPEVNINPAPADLKATVVKFGMRMTLTAAQHAEMVVSERYGAFKQITHQEMVEPDPAEVAAFKVWLAKFRAVVEEGEERDWIDVDKGKYESDDDGYLVLDPPKAEIVTIEDETRQEFHNRVDEAYMYYAEHQEWPADTRPSGGFYARLLHDAEWYDWKKRIGDELERLL